MSTIEKTLDRTPSTDGDLVASVDSLPKAEHDKARGLVIPPEKLEEGSSCNTSTNEKEDFSSDPPDGGLRAWLVVLGGACAIFATLGYAISWGVFQAYYEETLLKDSSPSAIAWIGSLAYALVFLPGLVSGRLFDMGYMRLPIFIASVTLVLSSVVAAECTKYWHFLLVQGLVSGLSCGILFTPSVSAVSHWFKKRKALALSVVTLGSTIGGVVFPIAFHRLISEVGFSWTMRIIALLQFVTLAVANICLAQRLLPKQNPGPFIDLRPFKSFTFAIYCVGQLTAFLGLLAVFAYIDISATSAGVSPNFSFYLVAMNNAGSSLGRLIGGWLGYRIGALNTMIPAALFSSAIAYAWPFASTEGQFAAIAVLFGITSGTFISLAYTPLVDMGDGNEVGLRFGLCSAMIALGGLGGPPVSGAINSATGGFLFVGVYAGSAILLSTALVIAVRYFRKRNFWEKI